MSAQGDDPNLSCKADKAPWITPPSHLNLPHWNPVLTMNFHGSPHQRRDLTVVSTSGPESIATYDVVPYATSADNNTRDIELILDVLFIFMSGIAIIVGLIILVYVAVVLFDRYCGCGGGLGTSDEASIHGNRFEEVPSAESYGPVAYKARLWGLTIQERQAILKRLFAPYSSQYATEDTTLPSCKVSSEPSSTLPYPCVKSSDCSGRQLAIDLERGKGTPQASSSSGFSRRSDSNTCAEKFIGEQKEGENSSSDEIVCSEVVLDEKRLTTTTCAICLGDYKEGDQVLHGVYCSHLFHDDCILKWMERCHDHCPYCRIEMMSPRDMRRAAHQVLEKHRLDELSWSKRLRQNHADVTPGTTTFPLANERNSAELIGDSILAAPHFGSARDTLRSVQPVFLDDALVSISAMSPATDGVSRRSEEDVNEGVGDGADTLCIHDVREDINV